MIEATRQKDSHYQQTNTGPINNTMEFHVGFPQLLLKQEVGAVIHSSTTMLACALSPIQKPMFTPIYIDKVSGVCLCPLHVKRSQFISLILSLWQHHYHKHEISQEYKWAWAQSLRGMCKYIHENYHCKSIWDEKLENDSWFLKDNIIMTNMEVSCDTQWPLRNEQWKEPITSINRIWKHSDKQSMNSFHDWPLLPVLNVEWWPKIQPQC